MNYMAILLASVTVGGVGIIMGCLLGIAEKKFEVKVNEKESAIRELLPGSNCGGCGYPGCDGMAAAIAKGDAPANGCPSINADMAAQIAEIMGVKLDTGKMIKKIAFVKCAGDCERAKSRYEYHGVKSCIDVSYVTGGGPKACTYGCLGYGECVKACKFDAISIQSGVAVVDKEKCVACGQCVDICPKRIIELIPYSAKYAVQCTSEEKGKDTKAVCTAGCIGCKMCARNCQEEAIEVENNIAVIIQDKCAGCGICAGKCPVKIIKML